MFTIIHPDFFSDFICAVCALEIFNGLNSDVAEDTGLLRCDAVLLGE
jgi:hypothetical protein